MEVGAAAAGECDIGKDSADAGGGRTRGGWYIGSEDAKDVSG